MESDSCPAIAELLIWGKDQLKLAGVEDFDISAEILLRDILGFSRAELFTSLNIIPSKIQYDKYRENISRRSSRTPLQYITGSTEFYNVTIKCDPRALIPRPETEMLVETVIDRLRPIQSPSILDIGTGSGNIAIALAWNIDGAKVAGVDISREAADLAGSNAELNEVAKNCRFLVGDIDDEKFVESLGRFHCVVSNPPYVSEDQKDTLQPEVIEFEPGIALFSLGDPLRFYKVIVARSASLLYPGGLLAFEVGMGQAREVQDLMRAARFENLEIIRDLAGIERVVAGNISGV